MLDDSEASSVTLRTNRGTNPIDFSRERAAATVVYQIRRGLEPRHYTTQPLTNSNMAVRWMTVVALGTRTCWPSPAFDVYLSAPCIRVHEGDHADSPSRWVPKGNSFHVSTKSSIVSLNRVVILSLTFNKERKSADFSDCLILFFFSIRSFDRRVNSRLCLNFYENEWHEEWFVNLILSKSNTQFVDAIDREGIIAVWSRIASLCQRDAETIAVLPLW